MYDTYQACGPTSTSAGFLWSDSLPSCWAAVFEKVKWSSRRASQLELLSFPKPSVRCCFFVSASTPQGVLHSAGVAWKQGRRPQTTSASQLSTMKSRAQYYPQPYTTNPQMRNPDVAELNDIQSLCGPSFGWRP